VPEAFTMSDFKRLLAHLDVLVKEQGETATEKRYGAMLE